ncbi:Ribonuclease H domain-containing protein [Hirschfeldia incana]|nr:Ribonuclease H domain-containing protein [Hirschfeldia incana]
MTEQEVVSLALKEVRIWQTAQQDQPKSTPLKGQVPYVGRRVVEAQCFVDAAWNVGFSGGGCGCIFKDVNNITTHQFSSNCSCVGSAFVAEALAVKACLKAARSLGLSNLNVWSDSKSLVMAISNKEKITEVQGILFDISRLCSSFMSVVFVHVPRLNNVEADALAKAALFHLPV